MTATPPPQPLLDAFFAALPELCRDVLPPDEVVSTWLDAKVVEAKRTWPRVELPDLDLARFLGDKVARLAAPSSFAELRVADLYLALACLRADRAAVAIFENELLPLVDVTLARLPVAEPVAEDLKSQLRERLFVSSTDRPPMMNEYSGRGTLVAWLRSIAVHAALKTKKRQARETDLDLAFELAAPEDSPELSYLRRRYASDFKAALERAFARLTPRERNLLRQHYLDALTVDDLAVLYRVHRATAARWVAAARQAVLREIRADLTAHLSLTDSEVDGMWAAARSELQASISRLLGHDS